MNPLMARFASSPRPLSSIRLFCIAFMVTFIGVSANLWMLRWIPQLFEQRHEVTEPSGGAPSRLPLLAQFKFTDLRIYELTDVRDSMPGASTAHIKRTYASTPAVILE